MFLPPFYQFWGFLSGVKPHFEMLALVIPYSETHYKVGHDIMSILLPTFVLPLLGLLSGVKPHLKWLALVIPFSGNTKVRYGIVFSIGPFYINKKQFCYPCFLLTSNDDFGVKAPPQTCQQSIFGILMAPQINPWGQTFWPS